MEDVVLMFYSQSTSSVEEDVNRVHSPSGQDDVESESEGREDHIYCRDKADSAVCFVRLGTGDGEARRAEDS
ncbi:hypothetical protein EVAR_47093_1 [Eumeta japonica]|uniref:Uncharacterized protein n=1 Tax=Eumeta variegata TaxID=151549 RepID=A0A4C1YDU4_EUMVA|nr:hypothetical protein EVAR_47093_1 [Eumeta japonica]